MSKLGYSRYDSGAGVTTILELDHPESVIGTHLTTLESDLTSVVDDADLSDVERSYLAVNQEWDVTERSYSAIQSTKPQTVGYGLNGSPVGLAAYIGEKWHSWSDVTPPDDFLCATLTGTEPASHQLIKSANTDPVESNMRRNDNSKSKDLEKRKTTTRPLTPVTCSYKMRFCLPTR
jgi:hypothetical protein